MATIDAQLHTIFRDVFDDDSIVLRPDLTADDVPEWDSLGHVRLLLAVQKTFGLKFAVSQAAHVRSLAELTAFIRSKTLA